MQSKAATESRGRRPHPTILGLAPCLAGALMLPGCSESEPEADPADQSTDTTLAEPQSPGEATDRVVGPPSAHDPDRADRGRILFAVSPGNCAKCHGPDAKGGDRAPNLTDGNFAHSDGSFDGIASTIIAGVTKDQLTQDYPFGMNARGSTNLTDQQCMDLAHYVRSLIQ